MSIILEAFSKTSEVWMGTYLFQNTCTILLWTNVANQLGELVYIYIIKDERKVSKKSVNVELRNNALSLPQKRSLRALKVQM